MIATIAREWTRIGCVGFGGPPAHIALLRELCVERRGWMDDAEFEDAIAACNLRPGPASTQLAILCAWRLRGWRGRTLTFVAPLGGGGLAWVALKGRRALLRRRLRDRPADAARRGRPVRLDDRRAVPVRGRARTGDAGAGHAHRRRRRLRGGGRRGALFAAAIAFAPSFMFVLLGGARFDALRANPTARAFLSGAGPAAVGAILGSAIPLALALEHAWQPALLAAALVALVPMRRGVVPTLVAAGLAGTVLG